MKKIICLTLLLALPLTSFGQLSELLQEMKSDKNPTYETYEPLVFKATNYIFSNPVNPKSKEFIAATKIVGFWMNKDTGVGIPTFGNFFTSLTNKDKQQFLYTVAMIHYGLDQKINQNKILKCIPVKGQKYSEQADVKEVQLEGAKILLDYIGNKKNNVTMTSKTKKYYKAHQKSKLNDIMFK